jgi:hypothetical protein
MPLSPMSSESSEGFFAHSDIELFILEVAGQPKHFGFQTWSIVRQDNQPIEVSIFDVNIDTKNNKTVQSEALDSLGAKLLRYWYDHNDAKTENKIPWLRTLAKSSLSVYRHPYKSRTK